MEFDHDPVKTNRIRPAESFMVLAADKCGPGAYNLPIFLGFADPMYCAGLMLPRIGEGFTFNVIDMDNTDGDSIISLNAPEDYYRIAVLLRDNERFGIDSITSRYSGQTAAAISATRLHNIAGSYTGKDDPVALVRNQGIFPAPEELISPFAKAHYVGGDARGSHVMPLMPVPINTPVTGVYCLPLVSCIGFSLDASGKFSDSSIDFSITRPGTTFVRWLRKRRLLCAPKAGPEPQCCLMLSWNTRVSARVSATWWTGSPSGTAMSKKREFRRKQLAPTTKNLLMGLSLF